MLSAPRSRAWVSSDSLSARPVPCPPVTGGGVGPDQTVAYPNYQTILTRLIVVPRSLATEPNVVACPDSLLLLVESASSSWG